MIRTKTYTAVLLVFISLSMMYSCEKPGFQASKGKDGRVPDNDTSGIVIVPVPGAALEYPDSILYPREQEEDYIVYPNSIKPGKYFGFPEGIKLDEETGAIDVNKSEAGLRYSITHVSPSGDSTSTLVVISGISFADNFYFLNAGDSIASPVYNADTSSQLPVNGSVFDEGNEANGEGCSITTDNARINLLQTVRNGAFGKEPSNDARRDFDIFYRLNDSSDHSLNKLKVRLYYYETMADVAPDLLQTLAERQQDGVFIPGSAATPLVKFNLIKKTKPRPPCIIIIANAK